MVKKILKWTGIVLLVLVAVALTLYAIYLRPVMTAMQKTTEIKYDKDLTIVLGGGGNSGVLVSDSLVIVIDSKMGDAASKFHDDVKTLAGNKPILLVNSHFHSDHTGGNKYYAGHTIVAGGNYTKEAWIKAAGDEGMPTIWLKGSMDIPMGADTVTIINMERNAHTVSDVFVYLHGRKMLFGGDVILNKSAPALIGEAADPDGYKADFDELKSKFAIQKIVPGHGPMGGIEVMDAFQQYFEDMKTAAADDSKKAELVAKYKDWTQVPMIMSPGATISVIKKRKEI